MLVARPDGGWELVDVGSTNGTTLALADGPIPAHRPVPLADGAVIQLGAWTTITLTSTPWTRESLHASPHVDGRRVRGSREPQSR